MITHILKQRSTYFIMSDTAGDFVIIEGVWDRNDYDLLKAAGIKEFMKLSKESWGLFELEYGVDYTQKIKELVSYYKKVRMRKWRERLFGCFCAAIVGFMKVLQ